MFVVIGTLGLNNTAWAANNDPQQTKAQTLTINLFGLNSAYQNASPEAKAQALDELLSVATERHDLLVDLIESDPAAISQVTLPADVRAAMPEEVRNFIEQKVEFAGELKVIYEDYDNGQHHLRYRLKDINSNSRVSLHFEDLPKGLTSGQQVSAQGVFLALKEGNGVMALESEENLMTLAAGGAGTEGAVGEQNSLGQQTVAVLLVNFQNNYEQPVTYAEAHDLVFNEADSFMQENSSGLNSLTGQVFGWYNLAINETCVDTEIATAAQAMAAENQVDLTQFSRIIYMLPNNPTCGWSGLATVGGAQSEAWINGKFEVRIVGHEIGHNYGLHHAHSNECGATIEGGSCISQEYGDKFSIMGADYAAHFNAFQKEQLGWLNSDSFEILEVISDGQYTLDVFENNTGTRAIKIPKGLDTSGNQIWYYLEYRQAIGFDAFLGNYNAVTNGILVRTGTDQDIRSSYLYDMTPASSLYFDWDDAALSVGSSYQDEQAGITISVNEITGSMATVDIVLGDNGGSGGGNPPPNQPPVAVNDLTMTAVNTTTTIPVLGNDYDLDGDAVDVLSATQSANGTVSVNADGTIQYKPRRKFVGIDTFSYDISDGIDISTATVTVDVQSSSGGGGGQGGGGNGKGGGKNK